MKVLIYDLLCTEVWKAKLYPLLKSQLSEINSVRSYMTVSIRKFQKSLSAFLFLVLSKLIQLINQVYHEVSTVNFLEVLMYHRTACEGADDTLVELIDYCYRKFAEMARKCETLADGQFIQPDDRAGGAKAIINQTRAQEMEL